MAIDGRVAHGVAGRHLEDALNESVAVTQRVWRSIEKRSTRAVTAKGARKELREYRQPITKHSLWWTEGEDRHDGPFLAWFEGRGQIENSLLLTRIRLAPVAKRSKRARTEDMGKLSLHSVARCLQRNGTLSWADVKPILAEAAASLVLMTDVAHRLSLRQIAVPAGTGLFVGDFEVDSGPTMQTYIVLDDAPSRWRPVRSTILEALSASELNLDALCAQAAYDPRDQWHDAIDRIEESLTTFSWLREKYDPRLDPVSAAWNDYRARVVGEPVAPDERHE